MAEVRPLEDAQHEAAHVVVGLALGLRLLRARVGEFKDGRDTLLGAAWFLPSDRRKAHAWALMYAAGIAWDRGMRHDPAHTTADTRHCRRLVRSAHDVDTCVRAAAAILSGRMRAHARVTRALLVRDITPDVARAICRNDWTDAT